MAVIADASTLALDELIDAAFAGRTGELEAQFAKTQVAGTSPGTIVSAALRQVAGLHRARLVIDDGTPVAQAIESMQPFVHFSRKVRGGRCAAYVEFGTARARHGSACGCPA